MTPVIFRKDIEKDDNGKKWIHIVAVFPAHAANHGCMVCYARIGQHSECSLDWYHTTRPAKPDEYKDLLKELEHIGYDDLKVYQRIQRDWLTEAWKRD